MSRNGSSLLFAVLLMAPPVGAALAHQGPAGAEGAPAASAVGGRERIEMIAANNVIESLGTKYTVAGSGRDAKTKSSNHDMSGPDLRRKRR